MEKENGKEVNKKAKLNKNLSKEKSMGITLIALIITIIVLLILAGVTIATLTGENGLLTRASDAKVITEISALKEDIDVYVVGEELNNVEGIERYPIIKDETMESINKDLLSIELKQKMSKWANTAQNGEIATIDTIDYSKFYKIDKEKVETAKAFEGDLYLIEVEGEYKVISINEVVYQKEEINIIIPLDDIAEPEYITVGNNTYKWYGNGELAVIGELNSNSGITSEENTNINGLQEFKLKEIAKGTDMAFDNNVETEQNIAKVNGVKKIYFNTGTAYIIDAEDNLWAWGDNSYNKLGQGNSYLVTEPTKILEGRTEGANNVKAKNVWAGATNTFVLDTNNRLWACGANAHGVLGQGNNNTYYKFVEVKIDGLNLNTIEIELYVGFYNNNSSSVLLRSNDGRVYGAGRNGYGNFGIGTNTSYNEFIELSAHNEIWKNTERIYNQGIITFIVTKEGTIYGAGYNNTGALGIGHTNNINALTKLDNDIIDVRSYGSNTFFKKKDGYLYTNNRDGNLNRINGLQDIDAQFLSNNIVVSNNKMYRISVSSISSYHSEYDINEIFEMISMNGFISNNKIYLDGYPNITKPKSKSIYNLRNVFTGAQFVQSGGNNINIVDDEGNIYEGINNKNTDVNNIKQIVSSNLAQFALSGGGKLYAKGNAYMWGDEINKSQYTIVTKDGKEEFNNIDKIFAIKTGRGCIFTTTEKEMYWAGTTSYVAIPNIEGDKLITGIGNATNYPKVVENEVINSIVDKIKDIKFNYINEAGIYGGNTLILTNDGKLYTYSRNSNMTGVGTATSDFTEIKFDGAVVEQIETLDGLSLAVLSNGEVYGWGYNTYGILGEGYELGGVYPNPEKLNLSNVRTMSLGDGFAIFGTYAGEVYGIGKNDYGQLGTGNNTGASTFVRCEELEK